MKFLLPVLILAIALIACCTGTIPTTLICPDGTQVLGSLGACPATSFCKGTARCYYATVTKIIDGDTIEVNHNTSIRLALVDAPEYNEIGGAEATEFVSNICQKDSTVLVDEDDGQTAGSYGRIVAVVYCKGNRWNINAELLTNGKATLYEEFCNVSKFANESWVKHYGC